MYWLKKPMIRLLEKYKKEQEFICVIKEELN